MVPSLFHFRSTRYVILIALEKPTAENVRVEMTRKIMQLPAQLRKSITWEACEEAATRTPTGFGATKFQSPTTTFEAARTN